MKHALLIAYSLFLFAAVIFSYLFVDPNLIYLHKIYTGFFGNYRSLVTALYAAIIAIFFFFYWQFIKGVHNKTYGYKKIKIIILITSAVLLFSYPAFLSFDIFNYIATAKVLFFYHENPYIIMPIAFTHDPLLLFMHAANKTALYAPVWILLTGIPFLLGMGNFLLTLFNFKLFSIIFYLATVFVLWKMTKNLLQTSFFALNPLIIIETLMSSHNDMSMVFFLLASFYFLFKEQRTKSVLFFILSFGIKYATGILVPLYAWHFVKPLNKNRFFAAATILMYVIFFLSSFREEIYPWYATWFLLPSSFLIGDNLITWVSTAFSFGLLLRYIPFMLLGTYFGPTPILKIILMLAPVIFSLVLYFAKHKKQISFI